VPPVPLGLYDHPDDTPGIESIEIPAARIPRFLHDTTRFLESIDDTLPGSASRWFQLLPKP
jgi:hypothetical protein